MLNFFLNFIKFFTKSWFYFFYIIVFFLIVTNTALFYSTTKYNLFDYCDVRSFDFFIFFFSIFFLFIILTFFNFLKKKKYVNYSIIYVIYSTYKLKYFYFIGFFLLLKNKITNSFYIISFKRLFNILLSKFWVWSPISAKLPYLRKVKY